MIKSDYYLHDSDRAALDALKSLRVLHLCLRLF